MRIKEFCSDKFYYGGSYECECGSHGFTTKVYGSVLSVANLYPKGTVAAVVCADNGFADGFISAAGKRGLRLRRVKTEITESGVRSIFLDCDVRFIISYGGEREADCAKRLGFLRGLPVFAAVCSPNAVTVLDGYCALWDNGAAVLRRGAVPAWAALVPDKIVCSQELPSCLGGIGAVASVLYDGEAYARSVGERRCAEVREAAFDIIYSAFDLAARHRRGSGELNLRLAELSLRLAFLGQAESGDFVRGAADCCARAALTLYAHERRRSVGRSEFAFIFSALLSAVYCQRLPELPPPDNNYRAELLGAYFGLDDFTAAAAAVTRTRKIKLAAYRMREYETELRDIACECKRVYAEAWKTFKRAYDDDGYFLRDFVDSSDVRTVLALSPDLFPVRGNALTLIRDMGALDFLL